MANLVTKNWLGSSETTINVASLQMLLKEPAMETSEKETNATETSEKETKARMFQKLYSFTSKMPKPKKNNDDNFVM